MTTQLAIGYLAAGRRLPRGRPGALPSLAHVTEHDSIDARPAIPRAVISWSDDEASGAGLPPGAGDPAADISGPPPFLQLPARDGGRGRSPSRVDGALLGMLGVLLLALAVVVAWQLDRPAQTWTSRDASPSPMALIGRVPVVELRVLGFEPVATPAEGAVAVAGKAKTAVVN